MTKTRIALLALATAVPAAAYHRQTPPIVAITSSGDTSLPHVQAGGRRLALAIDGSGRQIYRLDRRDNLLEQITTTGNNDNPSISSTGSVIAWDGDCSVLGCNDPGRQVFMWIKGRMFQVSHDDTGTSVNPAVSGKGSRLAFESRGDLVDNNNQWRQIFLRTNDGAITQVTQGTGSSRNPVFDRSGLNLVYDSTSSAGGQDTGIAQVWLLSRLGYATPLTNGSGPSERPAISSDRRLVAFESRAHLTGDLHDTGVKQIFVYEIASGLLRQVTNDAQGCTGATVSPMPGDWRIGYTCHGEGFFHEFRLNRNFRLPIPTGDTPRAAAELGGHFMVASTTANLLGSGTTAGHQIYLLNLYKLVAEPQ